MNRREFFGMLMAIPFLGKLATALDTKWVKPSGKYVMGVTPALGKDVTRLVMVGVREVTAVVPPDLATGKLGDVVLCQFEEDTQVEVIITSRRLLLGQKAIYCNPGDGRVYKPRALEEIDPWWGSNG